MRKIMIGKDCNRQAAIDGRISAGFMIYLLDRPVNFLMAAE
jgi:hypothetical protein